MTLRQSPAAPLPAGNGASCRQQPAKPVTFRLHHGDAVEWLRSLPSASTDLVVTDPPYESLEKHRAVGTTTRLKHSKASSNDWFEIFPNARFEELFRELWRVLKRNTHFYLFSDAETMFVVKPIAERVGFRFWKPIVWDKKKIGMGYHYRNRCEFILFFEKGKRKLSDLSIPDVIEVPRIINGYPTEKPVDVSSILIQQSSSAGECVTDPFMGAGSVGLVLRITLYDGNPVTLYDGAPCSLAADRPVVLGRVKGRRCRPLGGFALDSPCARREIGGYASKGQSSVGAPRGRDGHQAT